MRLLRLRTLTRKSVLANFGEFAIRESTVEKCLLNINHKWTLIHAYFSKSKISFNEDVLNELGITEKYRIEKPGINKELYIEFRDTNGGYEIQLAKAKHNAKPAYVKLRNAEKKGNLSKSELRDFNRRCR